MKSINVILYWIIVMVIGLSACGDDDEKTIPAHTEEEKILWQYFMHSGHFDLHRKRLLMWQHFHMMW